MSENMLSDYYVARKAVRDADSVSSMYQGAWMLTFSDLLMLLLCMFVMRLAMSTLPTERLNKTLSLYPTRAPIVEGDESGTRAPVDYWLSAFPGQGEKVAAMSESLSRSLGAPEVARESGSDKAYGPDIVLHAGDGFISATLLNSAFPGGIDELSFAASEAVRTIGKTFGKAPFQIRVDVTAILHPEMEGVFASDWDLSTARAMAVVRQFLDTGVDATSLSVGSYGSAPRGNTSKVAAASSPREQVRIVISLRQDEQNKRVEPFRQ